VEGRTALRLAFQFSPTRGSLRILFRELFGFCITGLYKNLAQVFLRWLVLFVLLSLRPMMVLNGAKGLKI
jgi:hypothetical protein